VFIAVDRVVIGSGCNVSCLDISGYVTAGNSGLATVYLVLQEKTTPTFMARTL
jgi:hypothetical protein